MASRSRPPLRSTAPLRSTPSYRPTPPLSPRLYGLEICGTPRTPSPGRVQTATPLDMNKPLPSQPRKSSSVYSDDSGYTKIIGSYGDKSPDKDEDEIIKRGLLEPVAYKETISSLLNRRLGETRPPSSVPSVPSFGRRSAISSPVSPPESYDDNIAPNETPSVTSDRASPLVSPLPIIPPTDSRDPFVQTGSLRQSRRRIRPTRLQHSPEFRAVSYGSTERYLPGPLSPRITDVIDPGLMPEPLTVHKRIEVEKQSSRKQAEEEGNQDSHWSRTSSSGSSMVFYHGVRESIKGYIHHKRKQAKENKERERALSKASAKYPAMNLSTDDARNKSSPSKSRRGSIQQGVANLYDKIRKFSISGSSDHSGEVKDPRRRSKQHAIPISPYQKYGAVIWDSPKRREKEKRRIREEREREMLSYTGISYGPEGRTMTSKMPSRSKSKANKESVRSKADKHKSAPLVSSFHSGQRQLVSALDETKQKLKRTNSEKRRENLKKRIHLIGPADQFADGRVNHWI